MNQQFNTNNFMMPMDQHHQAATQAYNGRDKVVLPKSYTPTDDVVIIGRGKKIRQHTGNQRFYALVDANLEAYQNAATKGLKSTLLWNILTQVRAQSQNGFGFIKKEGDSYVVVDDATARINIAQAFRDRLSHSYRSSKQHKSIKRKHDLGQLPLPSATEDPLLNENILASLVMFDLQQERPSKRVKTTCTFPTVPTSATASTKEGSVSTLRSILDRANKIACEEPQPPKQDDPFACLFNRFECFESTEDSNPFEPKPIQVPEPMPLKVTTTSSSNFQQLTASSCIYESQQLLEPIPLKAGSTSVEKRLSFSTLSGLDFSDEALEDCFDMVNALWTNDSLLVSN